MPLTKEIPHYTYADYLEWDENLRAEIIDGEVNMLATPTSDHQAVSMELSIQLGNFLKGKPCKVYAAPFSVRLFPKEDASDDLVLEPDIAVICDASKIDKRGCNGAPDFIIEILSPSSLKYDRLVKFRKYQQAGVREYWIVDPETKLVQVNILDNGWYRTSVYDDTEKAPVSVLAGCEINLAEVFAG
jgi:Uma2 family endonuclease